MTDSFKICLELTEELEKHKKRINHYKQKLKAKEQKLEKIKKIVNTHKQNECITCSEFDKCLGHPYCDEVILQIIKGTQSNEQQSV